METEDTQNLENSSEVLQEEVSKKSYTPYIAVLSTFLVLLIAIIGFFLYTSNITTPTTNNNQENTFIEEGSLSTLSQNESYIQAEDFLRNAVGSSREENLRNAEILYKEALQLAENPDQEGQILYKISLTQTYSSPEEAVSILKDIAANDSYSNTQRAYAVQRIGLLFDRNLDTELLSVIFSGSPYESFYSEGDTVLSFRRLYEYASSFYPLAISELHSAKWYANELKRAHINNSPNFENLKNEYVPLINQKLDNAESDIRRTRGSEGASDLIPEALYLKAITFARLSAASLDYDYESAMRDAINAALIANNNSDMRVRYAYALNLFLYEEGRLNEVRNLLEPFWLDIDTYPGFKRLFIAEKNNTYNQKGELVDVARSIPEFKEMLLSLGWSESDF